MVFAFPLGKTGGLIEASRTRKISARRLGCFRWVKPAASLKHFKCNSKADLWVGFPLGKTGGLIEASI